MTLEKTAESLAPEDKKRVAAFYDDRVENLADLNAKSVPGGGAAYHHSGIVRWNEEVPQDTQEALDWLYRTEEALTDLVWHFIHGLCPRQPLRFLDAGCGEGAVLARFIELAKPTAIEVTGITLSEKQAAIAKQQTPQGTWVVGDMLEEKSLKPGAFDVVLAIESTEYLGADRLPLLMERAASWLDHGGLLVIVAGSWINAPRDAADVSRVTGFDDHYLTKLSSTAHYRQAAEAAGLVPSGELNLTPTTKNYWELRAANAALRNSKDGFVERLIAQALEVGQGEFRAYAWHRR